VKIAGGSGAAHTGNDPETGRCARFELGWVQHCTPRISDRRASWWAGATCWPPTTLRCPPSVWLAGGVAAQRDMPLALHHFARSYGMTIRRSRLRFLRSKMAMTMPSKTSVPALRALLLPAGAVAGTRRRLTERHLLRTFRVCDRRVKRSLRPGHARHSPAASAQHLERERAARQPAGATGVRLGRVQQTLRWLDPQLHE